MAADPLDPFGLWRDMLTQFEKGANEFGNQASRSDAFNEGMGKAMTASLAAKKMSDDLSARYLGAMNLPSRADVMALGERLAAIEDRLVAMSAALEQLTGASITTGAIAAPSPRRTKRPPEDPAPPPPPPPAPPARRRKAKS